MIRMVISWCCGVALVAPALALAADPGMLPPKVVVPASYEYPGASERSQPAQADWWQVFSDPSLDGFLAQVDANNTTIAQALARLNAARADARLEAAALAPTVSVDGSASQAGGPLINAAGGSGSLFTARASINWEVDLSGRLGDARDAAKLDARSQEALLRQTRLLVEVEAVQTWFRARFLDAAAKLAHQRIALAEARLDMVRQREVHGLAALEPAAQAESDLAAAQGELSAIERNLAATQRQLGFLAGSMTAIAVPASPLAAPPAIPAGLPSEMLARRPDIEAALASLLAADKRLSSARKSWLPSLSLTATGGAASPSLGQFLGATAQSFGLNLLFGLPIFDGGRHKALTGRRKAEVELAVARYRECVLVALREVNDALGHAQSAERQFALAGSSSQSAARIASSAEAAVQHGTLAPALAMQRKLALVDAQEAELLAAFDRIDATLEVIRSLGGGW